MADPRVTEMASTRGDDAAAAAEHARADRRRITAELQLRYAAFQSVFQSAEQARSALARRARPARAVLV